MKKVLFLLLICSIVLIGCSTKETTEYGSDLQNVANQILENATAVEEMLNTYSSVWSYSIESRGAIPVEEMAQVTGLFEETVRTHFTLNYAGNISNDFSSNIHDLNSYYTESNNFKVVEEASEEIKTKISELNNPPEGYEKAYDEILDMYTYSEEYLEMALNPTGNLQSFNEGKNQLSSDILSQYKRIEATIPSEDN